MKKNYLLTPGPTPVPASVMQAGALPFCHHRTAEFTAILKGCTEDLKYLFCTKNDVYTLTSSGTGSMEAAVANLLSAGDKVITVEAGVFGARWSKIAAAYGLNVVAIKAEYGDSVPPERLEDALREHGNAKAVFTQLSETSTGAMMDIKGYGEAVSKTDAALVVDGISGIGAMEMQTDEWAVDVAVTGSQKGLMMPPGLAFISVSEKAWRLAEKSKLPKFYFDLAKAKKALGESGTPWTPAITLVMQLKEALSLIRAETMEGMWRRHAWLADAARSGAAALGLKLFAKVPGNVLTSIAIPAGMDGVKFVRGLRDKYGVVFAGGQESLMGKIFRIGHLGYMDRFDMIIALAAVEMALADAGYPVRFGAGVAAAEEILTHDL